MEINADVLVDLEDWFEAERESLTRSQENTRIILQLCESPMEQKFLLHFVIHDGARPNMHGQPHLTISDYAEPWYYGYLLNIYPQYKLETHNGKNYRADFMFSLRRWDTKKTSGKNWLDIAKLIVEVDGHEHHERTKEQAARDRSRDRAMTTTGLVVMRFTGSELYRDMEERVREIQHYLAGKIMEME